MTLEFNELIGKVFRNRHNAIYDPLFQKSLKEAPWEQWLSEPGYFEVKDEYIERFMDWVYLTKHNKLTDFLYCFSGRGRRRSQRGASSIFDFVIL